MLQQTHTISNKGLQSFAEASPDYEFAPVGLGSMHEQAKKLAEYGRNGDIYVVHAAEGETVIPLEVLNANPKIKELLFGQMRGMGLDPQEFVVGSELNSINPDTGLPEFFFKSVFRGVKKAVKSVAKLAKKAAPVVIPLAAAYFGIPFLGEAFGAGTFGASFIGGGIGSLAGGASLKDSLKAGLMSGGLASLSAGVMSGLDQTTPGSSFMGGIKSSFTGQTPVYALDQVTGKVVQQGTKYAASPLADVFGTSSAAEASAAASRAQFNNLFGSGSAIDTLTGEGAFFGDAPTSILDPNAKGLVYAPGSNYPDPNFPNSDFRAPFKAGYTEEGFGKVLEGGFIPKTVAVPKSPSLSSRASDLLFGADPSQAEVYESASKIIKENPGLFTGEQARAEALKELSPKLFGSTTARKVLPTAVAGLGLTAALGGFEGEPVEEVNLANRTLLKGPTGVDLFNKNQSAYLLPDEALDSTFFTPLNSSAVSTAYPLLSVADGGPVNKPQDMNRGGTPQFPRREMLIEGPGTETSDDIPAMLSDGEFVMNAQAVRGADPSGNGNRQAGAKNLYDMMRNFEMRA